MHTPKPPGQMGLYAAACGLTAAALRRVCIRYHCSNVSKRAEISTRHFNLCVSGSRLWNPKHLTSMAKLIGTTTSQVRSDLELIRRKRFPFKLRRAWFERVIKTRASHD